MKHNISKDCPFPIKDYISDINLGALVKKNQKDKRTSESLTCRFCANDLPESQEKGSEGQ